MYEGKAIRKLERRQNRSGVQQGKGLVSSPNRYLVGNCAKAITMTRRGLGRRTSCK
jgi:hypothetical protein